MTSLAFAPVSGLQGRGCDVQSVHAGACFGRVRQIQQDSLWRRPKYMPRELDRTTRGFRVAPESLDGTQNRAQARPRGLSKNEKWKLNIIEGKPSPGKENVNKQMGTHQIAKHIFRTLHVPYQSASKRTMAPQTAPCCPEAPPKAEKVLEKGRFFAHTGLKQNPRDVEATRTSQKKMARVTSCIFCFWLTQDSARVPVTWSPRETLIKKWRE